MLFDSDADTCTASIASIFELKDTVNYYIAAKNTAGDIIKTHPLTAINGGVARGGFHTF
jgi:hypothetical protein